MLSNDSKNIFGVVVHTLKNISMFVVRMARTRKIQSKIEPELEDHIKKVVPNFEGIGMSNYVREALIKRSKYKPQKQES
jgi:hypothetical protein